MDVGKIIKYHRKKNSMTQESLSQGICSVPYLSKLENAQLVASEEILELLCKRMNIRFEDMYKLEDSHLHNELFHWYELINDSNYEQAFSKKKEIDSKLDYIVDMRTKIYYEIFSIYWYIEFGDKSEGEILRKIESVKEKSNLMYVKQKYYMLKIQGYFLFKNKIWKESLTYLKKANTIGRELKIIEVDVLYTLAIVYSRLNLFLDSTKYIKDAKSIYYSNLEFKKVIDCETIIGINYLLQKEYSLAKLTFYKILSNKYLNKEGKASVLHNLGVLYFENKEYSNSKNKINESLNCGITNNMLLLKSYYMLSNVSFKLNQMEDGVKYLNLGKLLSEDSGNKEYFYKFRMTEYRNSKDFHLDNKVSSFLYGEVIPYFREFGDKDDYREVLTLLGEIYYQQKYYKKAADIYYQLIEDS